MNSGTLLNMDVRAFLAVNFVLLTSSGAPTDNGVLTSSEDM